MTTAAIIIVGGAARRMSGIPKPWISVGGRQMIDWVIDAAVQHVDEIVLVGTCPKHWTRGHVRWTVEQPPGGGPVPAVTAGVAVLDPDVDEVLLLAGDAPFVAEPLQALFGTELQCDGVAAEADGQLQYLCARVRRASLERALATARTSMRSVFETLEVQAVPTVLTDADTWEDIARMRQELHMDEWLEEVAKKLGIDPTIDIDAVLDLARDVAHNLERKYAPLTSYLLGYAVASNQLTSAQAAALAAEIGQLAKERA